MFTSLPSRVSVVAAGSSKLAAVAASMARNSWAQVTGLVGQNETLWQSGVGTPVIAQTNIQPWNPISKKIHGVGQGHGGGLCYWEFDDATNTFTRYWNSPPNVYSPPWPSGFGGGMHGYDHSAVNPYTGDFYIRDSSSGNGNIQIWRKPNGSSPSDPNTLVLLPPIRPNVAYVGVAGTARWAKAGFVGSGAQGCLACYVNGSYGLSEDPNTYGAVCAFDPLQNKWIRNSNGASPGGAGTGSGDGYHTAGAFSFGKNCFVYGGGNGQGMKLWKMDMNGNVTTVATPPMSVGVALGEPGGLGRFCEDPVSGNFLIIGKGQLWELNPDTNTWTQLASPPAGVVDNFNASYLDGRCFPSPISTYGVVAYVSMASSTTGTFFLYKR